jgi:hypothetical protein
VIIAYAGTLSHPGYVNSLVQLSRELGKISGKLLIIGAVSVSVDLRRAGMAMENVILEAPLPSDQLVRRLHGIADIMLLPLSFRPEDEVAMRTLFPSKIVDYFATGVPCLVWAPQYSSIAKWVCSEPTTTELVTTPDAKRVIAKIVEMQNSPERMIGIARSAAEVGTRYFSAQVAEEMFLRAIASGGISVERSFTS